jgi:lipopolysaccharide transport system permease protein
MASRYLSLVLYKTYADLKTESERTYAGFFWWIVEPILSMAVYFLVFGVIMDRGVPNYVQFLFVGLVPWRWLHTGLMHGANSILSERSLMQQVFLPKIVFPVVAFLTDTFKFLVVFTLVLVFLWVTGFAPNVQYLALPLVLVVQFLLVCGLTIFFAGVAPLLPDIRIVLDNVVRLWFFLSGIFYAVDRFSDTAAAWLRLNPMTVIIEAYRDILLDGVWPDAPRLAAVGLLGVVVSLLGVRLIRHYEYIYPKLRF